MKSKLKKWRNKNHLRRKMPSTAGRKLNLERLDDRLLMAADAFVGPVHSLDPVPPFAPFDWNVTCQSTQLGALPMRRFWSPIPGRFCSTSEKGPRPIPLPIPVPLPVPEPTPEPGPTGLKTLPLKFGKDYDKNDMSIVSATDEAGNPLVVTRDVGGSMSVWRKRDIDVLMPALNARAARKMEFLDWSTLSNEQQQQLAAWARKRNHSIEGTIRGIDEAAPIPGQPAPKPLDETDAGDPGSGNDQPATDRPPMPRNWDWCGTVPGQYDRPGADQESDPTEAMTGVRELELNLRFLPDSLDQSCDLPAEIPCPTNVLENEADAAKVLADKVSQEKLLQEVNFAEEKVVIIRWRGSGLERMTAASHQAQDGLEIVFTNSRPNPTTADLVYYFKMYAIAKDATWKIVWNQLQADPIPLPHPSPGFPLKPPPVPVPLPPPPPVSTGPVVESETIKPMQTEPAPAIVPGIAWSSYGNFPRASRPWSLRLHAKALSELQDEEDQSVDSLFDIAEIETENQRWPFRFASRL